MSEETLKELQTVAAMEPGTLRECMEAIQHMPELVQAVFSASVRVATSAEEIRMFALGAIAARFSYEKEQISELERMMGI